MHEVYDAFRPLYLKNDASGAILGAGLLQVTEGMNSGHDEVPGNVTLQPVAKVYQAWNGSIVTLNGKPLT